jgi:predicted ATPase/DNA-binding XRE family transcriptional regulator
MPVIYSFGEWLKQQRKRLHLTQGEVAAQTHCAIATIKKIERDQRRPSAELAELLAQALHVPPAQHDIFIQCARGQRPVDALVVEAQDEDAQKPVPHLFRRPALLPLSATPFIGRASELAQLGNLLANPDCRLLTLLGVGGLGKTRLAIETATRQAGNFADGVCFVALAPVGTADLVSVAIAQSLGLQITSSDLQAQIAAYLRPRELLLVLDNFEHLLEAAETVAHLLHNAPRIKALVTSRERLYLLEEWLLPITGLPVTEGVAGEAGQLFLRSVQRVRPDFTARGQEQAIAAICRQVEGMPLALELAASWVRVMPCEEIASQLVHNPTIMTTSLRNLPERHRSLRNLFDHSWRLLSADEQRLLRRVSVFKGGWTLAEAEAVAGATLPLLLSLVDKSLVRMGEYSRFELHELIHQYGAEQLAASGEGDLIRQRHYATYLQLARTADSKVRGPEMVAWYARLEPEQDNLRAALLWALDTNRFADAAWLGIALCYIWHIRAQWYEGVRWLEQLLPYRHDLSVELRLVILLNLYRCWRALHEFQKIDQYANELMQLGEACPDKLLRAAVWFYIANSTPDATQAVAAYDTCLVMLHEAAESPGPGDEFCFFADHDNLLAMTLMRYGVRLTDELGEYAQAALLSTESLKLFQARGNRDFIVYALGNLGRLARLRGDLAQARTLLQETITIAASVGNRMGLGDWQPLLGIVTFYSGEAKEGRRLLIESLNLCLNLRNDEFLAEIYGYLAEIALWDGELDQAVQWVDQSLIHQAKILWLTTEQVDFLWMVARLATAQEQYSRAAMLFGLAEQISSQSHYRLVEPVRSLVDTALATVREALDPAIFAEAFATGHQLSLNEAFATILAPGYKV